MFAPLQKGYLTQKYKGSAHWGIDLGWVSLGLVNPPIYAWEDGVVIASYFMTAGGNTIVIRHEGAHWYQTRYVHLHRRDVKVGDVVKKGQIIGLGGNTGHTTGPHLHFEVLLIPTGYKAFVYSDRTKYAVNPLEVTYFTEVTGEGVQKMNVNEDKLPLVTPLFSNVLMRSTPAILENNKLGHVPANGLRYHGETTMNGLRWALLKLNDNIVYSAIADRSGKVLLDIKDSFKEVIVEKRVEVVPAIDQTFETDKAIVRVTLGPK